MPLAPAARRSFPPQDAILAKALACEARLEADPPAVPAVLPAAETLEQAERTPPQRSPQRRFPLLPVSRFSVSDLQAQL